MDEYGYSAAGKRLFSALRRLIPVLSDELIEGFDDSYPTMSYDSGTAPICSQWFDHRD